MSKKATEDINYASQVASVSSASSGVSTDSARVRENNEIIFGGTAGQLGIDELKLRNTIKLN